MIEQVLCAGAAATNILLAARALGFNGVWKTGAAAYDETVKGELGFEPADALVGFLYIGTETDAPSGSAPQARWRERVSYLGE